MRARVGGCARVCVGGGGAPTLVARRPMRGDVSVLNIYLDDVWYAAEPLEKNKCHSHGIRN